MSNGNSLPDPADQTAGAGPTPSANPFNPSPANTQVNVASTSAPPPGVDPTAPPADFTAAVNRALQGRLGLTKYGQIPSADKAALILKIWQDPTIEQYYTSNHTILTTDVNAAGQFGNLINQVMVGQGNDPSVAVDYTNMLQAAGVPLTASEQAGLAGATQAINAPVPRPFATNVISGYDFGATVPATVGGKQTTPFQTGIDYGTPVGSRIVSPFAGTVHVVSGAAAGNYGNIVYVTLDNGWTMGFGHVAQGEAQNGVRVNPGDLIALSGANVGDSTGAVTIVTWQDPNAKWVNGLLVGGYQNPHDALDPIFKGTTFASLGAAGAAGTGMPTVNKVLDSEYPSIKSDWQQYFGSPPSPEDVYNILSHGSSPQEWHDYIRAMPSHIDGLNQGQAFDIRQSADSISTTMLGHPSTDGVVKDLYDSGQTSTQDIKDWYGWHSPNQIDKETYQKIYTATQPIMKGIFYEPAGADPRDINFIHAHGLPPAG